MFPNKNWRWMFQAAILIFTVVLVSTVIIPATAKLIATGLDSAGEIIRDWFRLISRRGESRLEGLTQLCLYLVFITIALKLLKKK